MIPLVVIAGFPASGKTSVIRSLVGEATREGQRPAVSTVRCAATDERVPPWALTIPRQTWASGPYCPDHELAQRLDDMGNWAGGEGAEVLFVETAGLCARCSPFPKHCVALFVADYSAGLRMPEKVGPMLATCDVCICTRPDRTTQTERLMFHGRVRAVNSGCAVLAMNGLTGEGGRDLWSLVARNLRLEPLRVDSHAGYGDLRSDLPQFFCSYCLGRDQVGIRTI